MNALLIASGAISILKAAMEEINAQVQDGKIPVEAQQAQLRKIDAIRAGDFSGPEWEVVPDPVVAYPSAADA